MADRIDLSGRWTGVYFYPIHEEANPDDDLPPTPFTAELEDRDGHVTGATVEPDLFGPPGAPPIPANLEGDHHGDRLTFTKFPDGGGQIHTIDYDGNISADGESISGTWIIHGEWSGTFRMQRRTVDDLATTETTAETTA